MNATENSSLLMRIDQAFSVSPHLCGRHLMVQTEADTVVVRGTVETYYQKQMAQEIVRRVEGVQKIDNQLEVSWG
jgi:osmotically-inducible protein OsmY